MLERLRDMVNEGLGKLNAKHSTSHSIPHRKSRLWKMRNYTVCLGNMSFSPTLLKPFVICGLHQSVYFFFNFKSNTDQSFGKL